MSVLVVLFIFGIFKEKFSLPQYLIFLLQFIGFKFYEYFFQNFIYNEYKYYEIKADQSTSFYGFLIISKQTLKLHRWDYSRHIRIHTTQNLFENVY